MSVVIPFFNTESNFRQEIILDNESYLFDFTWNERSEQWSMSILQPDETPLIYGVKLVLAYSLLDQFEYLDLPPGEFYCVDTTGDEIEVNRDNIGDTVELVYIPEAEVVTV